MRFNQYVTKNSELESWLARIENDCKPFLKQSKRMFFRGTESTQDFLKKFVRGGRFPKDTPKEIHYVIDEAFKKKFGWKARSEGVFATQYLDDAYQYGEPFMIFPIDNFKYVWSNEYTDLYGKLDTMAWPNNIQNLFYRNEARGWQFLYTKLGLGEDFQDDCKEIVARRIVSTYTNKDLNDSRRSEISFKCNEYYLLHMSYIKAVEEKLKLSRMFW
jgi:hypothetical protein